MGDRRHLCSASCQSQALPSLHASAEGVLEPLRGPCGEGDLTAGEFRLLEKQVNLATSLDKAWKACANSTIGVPHEATMTTATTITETETTTTLSTTATVTTETETSTKALTTSAIPMMT